MSFWSVGGSGRDYDDDNNKITIINLLYQFYIVVQQITKNLVPQNNTNLICYGSVGQKSVIAGLDFLLKVFVSQLSQPLLKALGK